MNNVEAVKAELATERKKVIDMPTVDHRDEWNEIYHAAGRLQEHIQNAHADYIELVGKLATAKGMSGQLATRSESVAANLHRIVGDETNNPDAQSMLASAMSLESKVGDHVAAVAAMNIQAEKLNVLRSLVEPALQMEAVAEDVACTEPTVMAYQYALSDDIETCRQSL